MLFSVLFCNCGGGGSNDDNVVDVGRFRRMVSDSKDVTPALKRAMRSAKELGRGLTATVYRAVFDGNEVAVKRIDKRIKLTTSVKSALQHEVNLLRHLQKVRSGHRHLCNFYNVYEDQKFIYVVLELCRGGELFDYIVNHNTGKHFSEKEIAVLILQIARGLHTLHMAGVVHRDLKPENVVLKYDPKSKSFPENSLKIMDFGFSLLKGVGCEGKNLMVVGSPQYMSPEICSAYFDGTDPVYTPSCDIWVCVVLFSLFFF